MPAPLSIAEASSRIRQGTLTPPELVEHAEETIKRLKVDRSRYEFQMLLGVAGTMRTRLVKDGHPLRVYVPFGVRWHAYSMRRLRENPGIAMHIIKNLFRKS